MREEQSQIATQVRSLKKRRSYFFTKTKMFNYIQALLNSKPKTKKQEYEKRNLETIIQLAHYCQNEFSDSSHVSGKTRKRIQNFVKRTER